MAALNQRNEAAGTILSIANYNDEGQVIEHCVNKNCVLSISLKLYREQSVAVMEIWVKKSSPETYVSEEGIFIDEFMLYGYKIGTRQNISLPEPWHITGEGAKKIYLI